MPHIRVIDGLMYEYDNLRNQVGPLAELGLNAYNYLERRLWSATSSSGTDASFDPDYTLDFPFLAGQGFRFLTVMAAPFHGDQWTEVVGLPDPDLSGLGIKSTYFPVVEAILDEAEANGIGLILCPCWNFNAVREELEEADSAFLDPLSKTRRYLKAFTAKFVNQFKDHPGVAGWMIAQESFNLAAFQPQMSRYQELGDMLKELAQAARDNDPVWLRMIHACNNGIVRGPGKLLDYYAEYVLPVINPDPIDCISETLFFVNEYVSSVKFIPTGPNTEDPNPFHMPNYTSQSLGYLRVMQARAKQLRKPYYVASFGVSSLEEDDLNDHSQKDLLTFIDGMARTGVQFASHWVWNTGYIVTQWKVLVTSQVPPSTHRPEVFDALRVGQVLMKTWPEPPIVRRGPTPAFGQYAHFLVNKSNGAAFRVQGGMLGSPDFSLSYTIRHLARTTLIDKFFFRNRFGATSGWTVSYNGESFLQLFNSTAPTKNLKGTQAPLDILNEWIRITWTVRHDGVISLYVNDFLWACGSVAISPAQQAGENTIVIGRAPQPAAPDETAIWELSDVIFYARELTPREVFEYGQYGIVREPEGRWKLDGNVLDSSGHGLHGVQDGTVALPTF